MTDSLTGLPPSPGPARDAAILSAVASGAASPAWTAINATTPDGAHTGSFFVLSDGLKLNGVRLSVSAKVLQQLADMLSASLMTPRLLDLAFNQAAVKLPPCPIWPNDESTECMDRESAKMDQYVAGRIGQSIAPIGKNWVISNVLLKAAPSHAALYGWATSPEYQALMTKSGVKLYPGTLPGIMNIQPLATPHDMNYVDYAMLTNLVRRDCLVDGNPTDIQSVFTDPLLSQMVSHEGPLRVLRQPGVTPVAAIKGLLAGGGAVGV